MMDSEEQAVHFKVVTAVHRSKNYLGVATYFENENNIWVDCFPYSHADIQHVVEFIKSTSKTNTFLLNQSILTHKGMLDLITEGSNGESIPFKTLKSSCWLEVNAKATIVSTLRLRSYSNNSIDILTALAKTCDSDRTELLQSLGALVFYLAADIFYLDKDLVTISRIEAYPKDFYLRMDSNTFKALQIFREETHPNWIKGKGKSKEGFSLFGIFDRTLSLAGRRRLFEWMSSPLTDMTKIVERQTDVEFFLEDENHEVLHHVSTHLKNIADVPHLMLNIKRACMKAMDWCKLYRSLKEWIAMLDLFASLERNRKRMPCVLESLADPNATLMLTEILQQVGMVLDIRRCEEENTIVIARGWNDELDQKLDIFDSIEHDLITAAQMVLDSTPDLDSLSVEYIPQLGFHVVVNSRNWEILVRKDLVHDRSASASSLGSSSLPIHHDGSCCDFRFCFSREDKCYLKHKVVVSMDEAIGDIKSEILDLQKFCLLHLEELLINQEVFIYYLSGRFANLDATFSLALMATEYNLVRPQLSSESVLVVKGGRHLLQELTVDNFVPNDVFATDEKNVSVITGPNSSGKSVYLKQIGLITYLAHIGSYVPCEQAIIGLTDRIFTRIISEESVSVSQSTFTIDLSQMAKMLHMATPRSLCLIDEFGKGTMPLDGIALLSATLKRFTSMRCRTFCVLHLIEALDRRLIADDVWSHINFFKMETVVEATEKEGDAAFVEDEPRELIPLYKLKYGLDTDAEGILCASAMGVATTVIHRAKEIKQMLQRGEGLVPQSCSRIREFNEQEISHLKDFLNL